jgi:hypothetical protein
LRGLGADACEKERKTCQCKVGEHLHALKVEALSVESKTLSGKRSR